MLGKERNPKLLSPTVVRIHELSLFEIKMLAEVPDHFSNACLALHCL